MLEVRVMAIDRSGRSTAVADGSDILQRLKDAYGQNFEQMEAVDEAALLVILGGHIYSHAIGNDLSIAENAMDFLPQELDETSDEINRILDLLEDVTVEDATKLIQLIAR
jgi:hypothetical protein